VDTLIETLLKAREALASVLESCTGLDCQGRKLVTYWTLATHTLEHVRMFPLLLLKGSMGTGKSVTLRIIKAFAFRPVAFSARGSTQPVIRDKLAEGLNGTAIVEEADEGWKGDQQFEVLLSDRYQRDSAEASLKVSSGDDYVTVTKQIFGATALHRRKPFADQALKGRSVLVRLKANHERTYSEFCENEPSVQEVQKLISELSFVPLEISSPLGIAARVWDSYKNLISVAEMCGDMDFLPGIMSRLLSETAALKADQSEEPDGLVLRAIIECISRGEAIKFRNVRFSEIVKSIRKNFQVEMRPQQIGTVARELGFNTKESHGMTVVVTDAPSLLKASADVGYEDEAIIGLRSEILRLKGPG
jgi:hypothetical protein